MSRVGKKPISIPESVSLLISQNKITITGSYGILNQVFPPFLILKIINNQLVITRTENTASARAFHGLIRALIQCMIFGVTYKFIKVLIAEGVGYKFKIDKNIVFISVGFALPQELKIPPDIEIKLESANKIVLCGINKQHVSSFADRIRAIKPPEPYKGKGLLYEGEIIRRKVGKTGKK